MDLRAILDEIVCATREIRSEDVRRGNSGVSRPTALFFRGGALRGMVGLPDDYAPGLLVIGLMTESDAVALVTEMATETGGVMKVGVYAPDRSLLVAIPYVLGAGVMTFGDPIERHADPVMGTDEITLVQDAFRKRAEWLARDPRAFDSWPSAFAAMMKVCGAEGIVLYRDAPAFSPADN